MNRQKAALAEELIGARKEIERQGDAVIRIAKEKEDLTRDKAELTVQVSRGWGNVLGMKTTIWSI